MRFLDSRHDLVILFNQVLNALHEDGEAPVYAFVSEVLAHEALGYAA